MKTSIKAIFISMVLVWGSASFAQTTSRWTSVANGLWSADANWTTVAPPIGGSADRVLEFLPAATYTADNNLDDTFGDFNLNMLRLGGGAVTLTGNALRFVSNGAVTPMITNNSAVVAAVNNNLELVNHTAVGTIIGGVTYLNGAISGTGSMTNGGHISANQGTGTIVLTGNNTYSGETVARIGDQKAAAWTGLILSNTTAGVAVPGDLKINGGMVRLGANEQIADTGVVSFGGGGRLMLLGRTETVAGIVSSSGSFFVENTDEMDPFTQIGPARLILNPAADNTYSFAGYLRNAYTAPTSNTLDVVKKGNGTQILSGANIGVTSGLGEFRIEAGTLVLSNTTANLFRSPIDITGTGKLVVELHYDASWNPITNNVANGLAFGLTNVVAIGGLSGAGDIELKNRTDQAVTLIVGSNNTSGVYSGDLSGAGSLAKVGTGDQTLSGDNAYAGTTTISGGLLAATHAGALPGYATPGNLTIAAGIGLAAGGAGWTETQVNNLIGNATFNAGARMVFNVAAASTIAITQPLAMSGSLTKLGTGTLMLQAGNTYGGGTVIHGGALVVSGDSTALGAAGTAVEIDGARLSSSSGDVFVSRTVSIGNNGATVSAEASLLRLTGTVSDKAGQVGSLRILGGGGTVVVTGANRYTGGTIVENGAHVAISGARAFGDGLVTIEGGVIRPTSGVTDFTYVTNAVTLSGNATLGQAASGSDLRFLGAVTLVGNTRTLTVEGAKNSHIDGVIGDGGNDYGLVKAGVSTLYLRGANTYTGITRVMAGTLALVNSASLASGTLQIDFGATMDVTGRAGGTMTLAANQKLQGEGTFVGGLIAGDLSILAPGSSPGTLEVSGDLTFEGTVSLEFDLLDDVNLDSDKLNVLGDLKKGAGFDSVVFDFLGSGQIGTYALIGFVNSDLGVGDFQFTNLKFGLSVDTVSLDNNELSLTVIPEPASLGLFGAAALAALLRRRLRR